jgi:hypothetical protein
MTNGNLLYTLVADKELDEELDKRIARQFAANVVEPEGIAELGSPLFKEGTIVLFVAEGERSEIVERLLAAAAAGDRKAIDEIAARLRESERTGLDRVGRGAVSEASHLVTVSYGTEKLARGVAPSMVGGVAVAVALWNGGRLDPSKFIVADYVNDADATAVSVHAVLARPRLTELEQAVIAAVPDDIDDLHLKGPSLGWTAVARAGVQVPLDHRGPVLGQDQQQQHDDKTAEHQQQQQQQDDTKVQQQQEQVQQADTNVQQQQQQQQDLNEHVQQQQEQDYQRNQTVRGQAQEQKNAAQTDREQVVQIQGRQGQQVQERHHDKTGGEPWLDNRQGVAWNPFDRDEYLKAIRETDFDALDATQSAHALLRIRGEFVRRGMP